VGACALRGFEIGKGRRRVPQADLELSRGRLVRRATQCRRRLLPQALALIVRVVEIAPMLHLLLLAPTMHGGQLSS
jgi:hypothetical protein